MAYLGSIFIAGTDLLNGNYKSGISFSLLKNSTKNYIYETDDKIWQVELTKGSKDVVARTVKSLNLEDLQSLGFTTIQIALDILAVKGIIYTYLDEPAKSNTGVYISNGKSILYIYNLIDFPISISCDIVITQTDGLGKVAEQPSPPEPIWNESFRYYRLSQSSNYLFEAYRNLFLAFEALLNNICQKKRNESEMAWLKRCLGTVCAIR